MLFPIDRLQELFVFWLLGQPAFFVVAHFNCHNTIEGGGLQNVQEGQTTEKTSNLPYIRLEPALRLVGDALTQVLLLSRDQQKQNPNPLENSRTPTLTPLLHYCPRSCEDVDDPLGRPGGRLKISSRAQGSLLRNECSRRLRHSSRSKR